MCIVRELDGIFFQDIMQMYLLPQNCYEPVFHLFFDG
jgi:hypothetical protein